MLTSIICILLTLKIPIFVTASSDTKTELDEGLITTTDMNVEGIDTFTKCFDEIGCVSADRSWFHKRYRPVNLKPSDRNVIQTEFVLIRKNRTDEIKNEIFTQVVTSSTESLESAGFTKGIFLFVLIHDFTSSGYSGWIRHISKILKSRTKKCNIVSVDWHAGAGPPYDQAIANARVVALEIIYFLKFLKEKHELTFEQVHLIGHGVGAHIAGYVGHDIKPKKITGLDPSGPRFQKMPHHVKLDSSDASYVEVLHTDGLEYESQGSMELFGHTDFFINNAENQPGCPSSQINYDLLSVTRAMLNEGEVLPGCSHKRAFKYYIESLEVEECTFLGIKCGSYMDFRQGKCTDCRHNCRTFGLVSYKESNNGSYYLQTASSRPYCLFQYRVTVQIKGTKSRYFGSFDFFLIDKTHFLTKSSMLAPRDFKPGGDNSFVFYAGVPEMGQIVEAKVGWKDKSNSFCLINCQKSIPVESIVIQSINSNTKYKQEIKLCPKSGVTDIPNEEYLDFSIC